MSIGKVNVIAAGLGWGVLERRGVKTIGGIEFAPAPSAFPAVTCVAQASMRTGLRPVEHGMVSNGSWFGDLVKPMFWEQSSSLVKGRRVWEDFRAGGGKVGLFFFQQSLGEDVDAIVSPAPIHRHGGGMTMSCYTRPTDAAQEIERRLGRFPLWRYWGPLSSPKVGRHCIDWFEAMTEMHEVDESYLYLPTLDYAAQKFGPGSPQDDAAFDELCRQIERLAALCERRGWSLSVTGDYEITPVLSEPARPNLLLREKGLFRTRSVAGRAYPDFYQSGAFAMCDHELCILCGDERVRAAEALLATGDYEETVETEELARGGCVALLAKRGSWCEYKWWTSRREAPDYAGHVDIHNKPGYDPTELFFFGRGVVKGTHGRKCEVAHGTAGAAPRT